MIRINSIFNKKNVKLISDHLNKRYFSSTTTTAPTGTVSGECTLEKLTGENEGISVISFNRGHVKNAIGKNLLKELRQHLHTLRFDSTTRVTIIRSVVDGVFCSGADLKERATFTPVEVSQFVYDIRSSFTEIETLPMPVIAAVEGVALGGGTEMILACDFRIASKSVKLGLPETGLAIIPGAGGTQRLPRLIGLARAKELIYTGAVLDSQRALDIGLIEYQTDVGKAFERSLELAKQIIPKGPIAIRMAKQAIDKGINVDIQSGMIIEQACYAQVIPTKDRVEGLTAFKEKRKPLYKGE
ncbi:enoyl-CoA hydratase/isomerase domain-containing protein [Tieghemostelium lacteum]|uniref:Enoyl-CoA hydratase/isomerase domain-containing protein n=1 Tax=Tieghemostelium lacteum TaxID=361077 RepID=A0A151ZGW1_TIELA|nr:enoyl-CoA hydratase/isomerase domain-containing protein [Tieghemostelium lacteum]|eukprot:KYQ93206.1 enoyl-CoA hydratase/isomerase domain-containing protein [Tieghemostelium lacteum]